MTPNTVLGSPAAAAVKNHRNLWLCISFSVKEVCFAQTFDPSLHQRGVLRKNNDRRYRGRIMTADEEARWLNRDQRNGEFSGSENPPLKTVCSVFNRYCAPENRSTFFMQQVKTSHQKLTVPASRYLQFA